MLTLDTVHTKDTIKNKIYVLSGSIFEELHQKMLNFCRQMYRNHLLLKSNSESIASSVYTKSTHYN